METHIVGSCEYLGVPIRYTLIYGPSDENVKQYGILAEYQEERVCIPEITAVLEDAQALAEQMLSNCVPLSAVRDVVDDWLLR